METDLAPYTLATIHPSAILHMKDDEREAEYRAFVDDLSHRRARAERNLIRSGTSWCQAAGHVQTGAL